jgi:hypothetical protein
MALGLGIRDSRFPRTLSQLPHRYHKNLTYFHGTLSNSRLIYDLINSSLALSSFLKAFAMISNHLRRNQNPSQSLMEGTTTHLLTDISARHTPTVCILLSYVLSKLTLSLQVNHNMISENPSSAAYRSLDMDREPVTEPISLFPNTASQDRLPSSQSSHFSEVRSRCRL